jgi:hypothetical protein
MAEIFRGLGKVVGGVAGLLGGRAPKPPALLQAPSFSANLDADAAQKTQRRRAVNSQGVASTLLSTNPQIANPGLQAPIKSLLGG